MSMKGGFYLILSILLSGFITYGCGQAFGQVECETQYGANYSCFVFQYKDPTTATRAYSSVWNSWNGLNSTCTSISRTYAQSGTNYNMYKYLWIRLWGWHVVNQQWQTIWTTSTSASYANTYPTTGLDQFNSVVGGLPYGNTQDPTVLYPGGCGELPADCSELEGDIEEFFTVEGSSNQSLPVCENGCELEGVPGVGVKIRKTDCDSDGVADDPCTRFPQLQYTGQDCTPGDPDGEQDDRTCAEQLQECAALCDGGEYNETCTDPGEYTCECDLPEYPVIQTGPYTYDPDQDDDGLGTNDPAETDPDGDGLTGSNDSDPDGDGIVFNDGDPDGDGSDNRGRQTFRNNPRDNWSTNHNGIGADADGDNDDDGTSNGADDDTDGDGELNRDDPDADGDGVGNCNDLDVDGDGILNGSDPDADGDGLLNADDPDPFGCGTDTGDTNDDGTTDSDDPPAEDEGDGSGTAPGAQEGGSCPDGEICIGDGVCQSGEPDTSTDCATSTYFRTRFDELKTTIEGTGLFGLTDIDNLPSSSDSIINYNLGGLGGEQTIDLADYNAIWSILYGALLFIFGYVSVRIILLKR